ncbi:U5 small nuclear ribonucleoprotein 40 kDa protein [Fasciolopsis buskii]|uniref:U5 small nuclear ribonucleoprotein 40 kDa protein n=1 Tax=Fasciolopsis buskii TaxID=27845 RepID=A0A8E0RNG8_9TREM|nr:U5 small nuclear ribonucleoprotein 40 kDa protein [Fasciolopsis buski]
MDFKRPLAGVASMSMVPLPAKKGRYEPAPLALAQYGGKTSSQIVSAGQPGSIPRTSNLQAPNMLLDGHDSEIYCGKFASDGSFLVSAGFDRKIMLWETYGDCENIATLLGKLLQFYETSVHRGSNSLLNNILAVFSDV